MNMGAQMTTLRKQICCVCALILATCALCLCFPLAAHADEVSNDTVTLDATGVSDFTTTLTVQKLDQTSHSAVDGAHLQILDAQGNVKSDWWTNQSGERIDKVLDVNTVYTLHEVSAPDGYDVAADVRFTINATDGEVTFVDNTGANVSEIVNKTTLNLYDAQTVTEKTVTVTQPSNNSNTGGITQAVQNMLPKTGDYISWIIIILVILAVAGLAIAIGVRYSRRNKK